MSGTRRSRRALLLSLAITLLAVRSVEARSVDDDPTLRILDLEREQRFILSLGPVGLLAPGLESVGRIMRAERVARAAMWYRVEAALYDSSGRVVGDGHPWRVDLLVRPANDPAGADFRPLAHLRAAAPVLILPKPLGYDVRAGDSLMVVITVAAPLVEALGSVTLQVTVDYEPVELRMSRLAVLPMGLGMQADVVADETVGEVGAHRRWDWTQEMSGRLLAISGSMLDAARELRLEDAQSGAVLWWTVFPSRAGHPTSEHALQCIRLGVVLEAGRSYRLTVISPGEAQAGQRDSGADVVHALLLPSRSQ